MKWRHIQALTLRYLLLYTRSIPRVLEMFFWPVMDLIVWGLVTKYLLSAPFHVPGMIQFLIGAMILWDILYRAQQGVTLSFLEDVWSRNLINLFVAPITLSEFIAATFLVGLIRILLTVVLLALLAFFLYDFSLWTLHWSLLPFFANLLFMGWSLGLMTTAMIIRWGQGAEALAWAIPFLVQPFCAVFYPVTVLPPWIQPIARLIPATHVFEGMRAIIAGQGWNPEPMWTALGLNVFYAVVAAAFFVWMFRIAQRKALLVKLGTQ